MSRGGSKTHIQPLIPWGGRMRSSLKLPKKARGRRSDAGDGGQKRRITQKNVIAVVIIQIL